MYLCTAEAAHSREGEGAREGVEKALSQKASVREQCKYAGQIQRKGWHQLQMCHKQTDSLKETEEQSGRGSVKHTG